MPIIQTSIPSASSVVASSKSAFAASQASPASDITGRDSERQRERERERKRERERDSGTQRDRRRDKQKYIVGLLRQNFCRTTV